MFMYRIAVYAACVLISVTVHSEPELTIDEAERLALDIDPRIKAISTKEEAYMARSIADGQLPDPKLKLDLSNVPVDGFDLDQEPMTQIRFGVIQNIPPGDTLLYRQHQAEALSSMESMRVLERRLNVIREVRLMYLERYLQVMTLTILEENRSFFSDLLEITERQYAAGRDNQHNVIRSQLELSLIDERMLATGQKRDAAIAALSRYIGMEDSLRPIPESFPQLHHVDPKSELEMGLDHHPLIRIENAIMEVNKKRIAEVEESYKPGYTLDVTYGHRSGNNLDGSSRPDFLSAMLLVDIPLFTDKRQDQRLAEATKNHLTAMYSRTDRLYEIRAILMKEYSDWETLGRRLQLFEERVLAEARDNTEATLNAYQNDITDFTTLIRAQLTELNTSIETLKVRIDRARAQVNLLYFGGEE